MKKLQVVFVSKPFDLEEVLYWQQAGIRTERVEIAETVRLSADAYDDLVSDFCRSRAWLWGKGGREKCRWYRLWGAALWSSIRRATTTLAMWPWPKNGAGVNPGFTLFGDGEHKDNFISL